ncbi:MAG TPA: hypothetical protein VNG12_02105, partial [Acidimicrobiales bacterium]|nr:hypothetical protein [Acidimicrobiales bacterium]
RNITTETRPDRIPFATLLQLYKSYDIAQICSRHAINDLRSMRIRFEPVDGYTGKNPSKEIAAARQFWHRPDKVSFLPNWLAKHAMDVWRYDAGTLYKQRDRAGNLKALKVVDGTTLAPMLDYFGDRPTGDAPAFQQFIQGIPWDWLSADDIVYEPMWPEPESPYGTPPLETILVNANTDIRLQLYFLQFFTAGNVPEAFAIAPEDQSDPDGLAELQETWQDWTYGDQSERWGLRWLPNGTEIQPYKPQEFDPDVAEYVMRRTVSAFMMVPNDMGFTSDVNRASGDTQVDVQFRIGTSPNVGYYQAIMDAITQEDLGLPVQCRFDTGREKEDRLMEAKAHYVYWQMGAERSSEVRRKILGYEVAPEDETPLTIDNMRLGIIPMEYVLSISGAFDPLTGMPKPGSVEQREFVVPGMMAPDPLVDSKTPHAVANAPDDPDTDPPSPKAPARKGAPGLFDEAVDLEEGDEADELAHHSPSDQEAPGYGTANVGSTGQGTGVKSEADDLRKWRSNARKAVARGKSPRPFADSAISDRTYSQVWPLLKIASTREQVDAAFKGGGHPKDPEWAGFHRHTDLIVDHYAPMVRVAMSEVLSPATLRTVIGSVGTAQKAIPPQKGPLPPNQAAAAATGTAGLNAGTAGAAGVAAGGAAVAGAGVAVGAQAAAGTAAGIGAALIALMQAPRMLTALRRLLTRIYGDAYMQGAHEAAEASGGSMPPWTATVTVPPGYWDNWGPGAGEAASQVGGGGLAQLLIERDAWIKEMTDTQVNRIGQAVEAAMNPGPVDIADLTAVINEIVNDEKRAWLIAETEYGRARMIGLTETYRRNNVPEVRWIAQPDCCVLCAQNEAVSPIPVGAHWPNGAPLVHVRCRCALAPLVHVPGRP